MSVGIEITPTNLEKNCEKNQEIYGKFSIKPVKFWRRKKRVIVLNNAHSVYQLIIRWIDNQSNNKKFLVQKYFDYCGKLRKIYYIFRQAVLRFIIIWLFKYSMEFFYFNNLTKYQAIRSGK